MKFGSKRRQFNTIFQVRRCDVFCLKGEWVSAKQCEIPVPLALFTPTLLAADIWWKVSKRRNILCVTSHSDVLKKRMSVFQLRYRNFLHFVLVLRHVYKTAKSHYWSHHAFLYVWKKLPPAGFSRNFVLLTFTKTSSTLSFCGQNRAK